MVKATWQKFDVGFVMKKAVFYLLVTIIIFSTQFLYESNMVFGTPPSIPLQTIDGRPVLHQLAKGSGIIYFWAEWCSLCKRMQTPVSNILADYPGVTVAVKSGDKRAVTEYLLDNGLHWRVANDANGEVSDSFGVFAVPTLFFFNKEGKIIFASSGYTSESGIRIRLWLSKFF